MTASDKDTVPRSDSTFPFQKKPKKDRDVERDSYVLVVKD